MRLAIIGIDLGKNSCSLVVGATGGMRLRVLDLARAIGLRALAATRVAAQADLLRERGRLPRHRTCSDAACGHRFSLSRSEKRIWPP